MKRKEFHINQDFHELTKHRMTNLSFACYETTIAATINGYIPLHWHEELQFVLVIHGIAVFQIDDQRVEVEKGCGLFVNSGILHSATEKPGTNCTYICLNISPYFIISQELYVTHTAPYIHATNLAFIAINRHDHWGAQILTLLADIKSLVDNQPLNYEVDLTINFTLIWKNIIGNACKVTTHDVNLVKQTRLKNMIEWIHANYSEKITLEKIASVGQLSRSECCRYFKTSLKTTPLTYVITYRIQKSLVLLQQLELTVTEIAYELGFNSTSYFIEKFKKSMAMTPLTYRKSLVTRRQ
ncbi:AraC family transcriptional regulator [Kurthia sibirica]|uniref:AraC family transcriptional regulator n=1 Tax=Kurthia sibirica TaxID=202750 RepID=A0A2U3AMZ0_9BACL|nr:AraC family transcriptional regulator [Kurthia sibirica]PWI25904.1 AraC family transcriptional regulator [Kurthia sibirica]GEK34256.1 putative HTH-type transcriptional regulator YdeC [Kurthia sibirica]